MASAGPVFEITRMLQQAEVRTTEDDWTGKSDAAARRKLQNRLNQRLYRRRRAAKPKLVEAAREQRVAIPIPLEAQLWEKFRGLIAAQPHSTVISTDDAKRRALTGGHAQIAELLVSFGAGARRDYLLGSPRADQLLTLIQFNVLRALILNTSSIGWGMEWLECSEPISPWHSAPAGPDPLVPPALRPTSLQRKVEHHPWIDLWPIPRMRDNLLLAGDGYDEDLLCNNMLEFQDVPHEHTGLIVWGDPWDASGWEASEVFVRDWGWVLWGCAELQQSTNFWRAQRGQEPLVFEV